MKSKATTVMLIIAVLAVWGIIIYRVVSAVGSDDEPIATPSVPIKKAAYDDYSTKPDTTPLKLNYRDPFGQAKHVDTTHVNVSSTTIKPSTVKMPDAPFNWGFIKYMGFISNPGSKKSYAMISINGKSTVLSAGESIDDVKLLATGRDSIKVMYKKKIKFITRG